MKHPSRATWLGIAIAFLALVSVVSPKWGKVEDKKDADSMVSTYFRRDTEPAKIQFENRVGESLAISLRRFADPGPDGTWRLRTLPPPTTAANLEDNLKKFGGTPVAISPDGRTSIVTRDLVIRLNGEESKVLAAFPDLSVRSRPEYAPGWVILRAADSLGAVAVLPRLRATQGVATATVAMARQQIPRTLPNDPLISSQWHLKTSGTASPGTDVKVAGVWNYGGVGIRGAGVRIGIVDDGLEQSHPDLASNVDVVNAWDWNGNDPDPAPGSADAHGTACAGIAAARAENALGGSGVAPEATLVGMRLIAAPTTDEQEAEAIIWKKDLIQVKSNSWGPSDSGRTLDGPGPLTLAALEYATSSGRDNKGTIFVWAAGNGHADSDNSNNDGYANSIFTIATAAMDSSGNAANYSEAGANLVVCAPSDGTFPALGITTTDLTGGAGYNPANSATGGDYTDDFGGTSAAAPVVAGVVALMLEKNPLLGWRDVQEILIRSATRVHPGDSGWVVNGAGLNFHPRYGAGLVNAEAAVALAEEWQNLAVQQAVSQTLDGPSSIPENGATGITLSFQLSNSNTQIEHVTLTADITHSSRGNLEITLTSPAGTVSRLAEVHNDINDNFPSWTFSTVRDWGETADGDWILKIADRSPAGNATGGTLNSATLQVFGTAIIPQNPPPVVAIVSPGSGGIFTPGSTVPVSVTASDLTEDGSPGSVAAVELLDNGVVVGSVSSAPYDFQLSPSDGPHQLVARATDTLGKSSLSSVVVIALENRPPVIVAVLLGSVSQAFADRELRVQFVSASDPDGGIPEFLYQWQSSVDATTWQDAVGENSTALTADVSRAGRLWRCRVVATDGISIGPPLDSQAVNLLARPDLSVLPGQSYQYQSGLVVAGSPFVPQHRALIHEFSQGPSGGNSEWVEILVLQQSNLGFWDLSDTTNTLVFKNSAVWNAIPAGTLIVVYNGNTPKDPALPDDDADPSGGSMVVSSTDPVLFNTTFDSWIPLSNNGDVVSLNDASSMQIDSLSYGSGTGPGIHLASVGSGTAARFVGDTEAAAGDAGNWDTGPATGMVTPGASNGKSNAALVSSLKNGHPVIPARFRLASGYDLPAGLQLDPITGKIFGTVTETSGNFEIRIERFNDQGGLASQGFVLTVDAVGGYESWIAGFVGLSDVAGDGDPDGDGLANLVEYAMGRSPVEADTAFVFGADAACIFLDYRVSKLHADVDLVPEWSPTLGPDAAWSSDGISLRLLDETSDFLSIRATLAIDPWLSRRFLRLRASSP